MEISAMLKNFLMTENYEVIAVSDGESACEKFFSDDFGLVLHDRMIPKRNGVLCCLGFCITAKSCSGHTRSDSRRRAKLKSGIGWLSLDFCRRV